jgi:probable F420-dependent oxidoreductase
MKIVIGIGHTTPFESSDIPGLLEMARIADEAGVYGLEMSDHLIMTEEAAEQFPYGRARINHESCFYEPLTMLAAFGAVTKRIRLHTSIVVAPLRSTIYLAKQIATVDQISQGRLTVGVGAGWLREEIELTPGVSFSNRFSYLDEQVAAWRQLWGNQPATFDGKFVSFKGLYAQPAPRQGVGVPVLYGMRPTERNLASIAAFADGWEANAAMSQQLEYVAMHVRTLREAFAANGRDPDTLQVGVTPRPVMDSDGRADLAATLDVVAKFADVGATHAHMFVHHFGGIEEYASWVTRLADEQRKRFG